MSSTPQTPGVADHAAPTAPLILREPVRLYLYGIATAVIVVLVAIGVLDGTTAPLIGALVAAVLAVPVTEVTRQAVVSPATAASVAQLAAIDVATSQRGEPAGVLSDDAIMEGTRAALAQARVAGVPGTARTLPLAA